MRHQSPCFHPIVFLFLFAFILSSVSALAKKTHYFLQPAPVDSAQESKTDYLEKIYFSGGNKEALTNSILMTLQQLEPVMVNKTASSSIIAQYTFLDGIKGKLEGAKDACAITDMLAAGIYNLNITEAVAQNIPRPEAKVTADLGALISKTQSISTSSNALAWNAYALSGGKLGGFGTASKLGSGASAIGNAAQTAGQIKDIAKTLFTARDKTCKSVTVKTVAIDIHPTLQPAKVITQTEGMQSLAANNTVTSNTTTSSDKKTVITITGADYAKLSAIEQNIKACAMVKSTTKKFNVTQSIIEVVHTGSSDDLVGLILQTCKDSFKQSNITGVEEGAVAINLAATDIKKTK